LRDRLAAAVAAGTAQRARSIHLEASSAGLEAERDAARAEAATNSEKVALASVHAADLRRELAQARAHIAVQKRVISNKEHLVQQRLERGLDLIQAKASDSKSAVKTYLDEAGNPKQTSASALLEETRKLDPDAAFLLDLISCLLRGPSYHATSRRIAGAISEEKGIRLNYNKDKDDEYAYPEHSKDDLLVRRDRRDAKLATQVLVVTDTFISARSGGRKVGFIGFLLAMCLTAVGCLTQLGQSFASAVSVMPGSTACYEWAQTLRLRWFAFYHAYFLAHVTLAGILFIFDNYALLEFAKTPDGAVTCRSGYEHHVGAGAR
jgi:hypothetical protein